MVDAVDVQQNVVLCLLHLSCDKVELWRQQKLYPIDAGVLEATTNTCHLYDQLVPVVASVTIANPLLIKWINPANIKNDAPEPSSFARLLAASMIPSVWVLPEAVRQLRALVSHRQWPFGSAQASNRLHGALHRRNLTPPKGGFCHGLTCMVTSIAIAFHRTDANES
jgi:hypothetical protein